MNVIEINVDIEVPDGELCTGCKYKTPAVSLYSEPECLIFKKKLDYVVFDRYSKCQDCISILNKLK